MKSLFDGWRAAPVTFDQQVAAEAAAFHTGLDLYRGQTGGDPDRYSWFTSPMTEHSRVTIAETGRVCIRVRAAE